MLASLLEYHFSNVRRMTSAVIGGTNAALYRHGARI
jgi:hypothetical protein